MSRRKTERLNSAINILDGFASHQVARLYFTRGDVMKNDGRCDYRGQGVTFYRDIISAPFTGRAVK